MECLEVLVSRQLAVLQQFDDSSNPEVVKQQCALGLRALFIYLPLSGFILRSTNNRNAFEVHGPLLRLAGSILEPGVIKKDFKTRLLLSSEWDYSPLLALYPALPDFVLIGLPAPESANPLLLPLAGHELGHLVWMKQPRLADLKQKTSQAIIEAIKKSLG